MINKLKEAIKILVIQIVILSLFLILAVIVIELRDWYKYSIKLPKNDSITKTWGHLSKNNKWGFREKDFTPSLADHFTILVLGDSLTWGAGLDEKQRYSNLLETYLQSEYPNIKIAVLNFGLTGGPTTKERDILRSFYKAIKPDLIIVGFCLNDPQEKSQDYSKEREAYFSKINPMLSFLNQYKMNGMRKLVAQVYEKILIATKKIPQWADALDRVYNQDSADWHRFEDALKEIAAMSKEVTPNLPLFISLNQGVSTLTPTDYNKPILMLNKYFLRWYHQVELAAKKRGFITMNCEEEFKAQLKNHVMAVMPGEDGHPTAEMNKIYAQKLFSIIKNLQLVGLIAKND